METSLLPIFNMAFLNCKKRELSTTPLRAEHTTMNVQLLSSVSRITPELLLTLRLPARWSGRLTRSSRSCVFSTKLLAQGLMRSSCHHCRFRESHGLTLLRGFENSPPVTRTAEGQGEFSTRSSLSRSCVFRQSSNARTYEVIMLSLSMFVRFHEGICILLDSLELSNTGGHCQELFG
jgi:hypothetical protein